MLGIADYEFGGELPADGLAALRWTMWSKPEIAADLPRHVAEVVGDCLAPKSQRPSAQVLADQLTGAAIF